MAFISGPPLLARFPRRRIDVCGDAAAVTPSQYTTRRLRAPGACAQAASSSSSGGGGDGGDGSQSVSEGVTLPEVHPLAVDAQTAWLEIALRHWLDGEFRTDDAQKAHREIARRASLLYRRMRSEGVHDLTTLVLELGGGLENCDDFVEAFVGPWNVANKAGELLIQNMNATAPRGESAPGGGATGEGEQEQEQEFPVSEAVAKAGGGYYGMDAYASEEVEQAHAVPPMLDDAFAKYRFMQLVLDGEVTPARINGAVAQEVGFVFDNESKSWSGANVRDSHFAQFGDVPPDVLGDEDAAEWTATLAHMETMLMRSGGGDEGKESMLTEGLQTLIETLNGIEMTKMRQADEKDHAFSKRSVVVKWLHMVANYC